MLKSKFIRLYSFSVLLFVGSYLNHSAAQSSFEDYKRQIEDKFNRFKDSKQKEFEDYRNRVNQEFAEFMRSGWDRQEANPPVPVPEIPEPPKPVVADPDEAPAEDILPFDDVIDIPDVPAPPTPLLPIPEQDEPDIDTVPELPDNPIVVIPTKPIEDGVTFNFYGSCYTIPFKKSLRPTLVRIDENSVADAWKQMSGDASVEVVRHCVDLRNKLCLPDWGYFKLTEKFADAVCPDDRNASTLLQMFLLTQSGYKVRIGRKDDRLVILMPSKEIIYNYVYVTKNSINYYVIDSSKSTGSIYVFDREFPREQQFSLAMIQQPSLAVNPVNSRNFSIDYPVSASADVAVNKNLIDFYDDYPLNSHWNLYANASLSQDVKEQIYPVLRSAIEGKRIPDAANILLHFVQKAFKYKTDQEQFGVERSLFPDETFYYPYSDCEDRAILYSVLVKELLGLKAVLVAYPGHLATAVKFDEDVPGDYFNIEGEKYTVCDPTYINADIGMAMKRYKNTPADIIKRDI